MLMNHRQVQCPENKDQGQKAEVKYSFYGLLAFISKANHSNIMVIQAYAPTSNAEEAEVERFYEDLQDLLH